MKNRNTKVDSSVLAYYKNNNFNPVLIKVEKSPVWESHVDKRRNLYERHLRIPFGLLNGRSVIEFGCNSGENALVLALAGADLTLVEPNEQVIPRLKTLFDKFELSSRIKNLVNEDMDEFQAKTTYDIAIAEGFLYTLDNRDALLRKMAKLLSPGGIGVVSFCDRYGGLFEFVKKLLLWRVCRLNGIDVHSDKSLKITKEFCGDEYARLNASRSIDLWWKDTLVNPFITWDYLWSYQEILSQLEKEDCLYLSSSPQWSLSEHFDWYKNTRTPADLHKTVIDDWKKAFSFTLTGRAPKRIDIGAASDKVVKAVFTLMENISAYATPDASPTLLNAIRYPTELDAYFKSCGDPDLTALSDELKKFFDAIKQDDPARLISTYRQTKHLRRLWGTVYHYVSFVKCA